MQLGQARQVFSDRIDFFARRSAPEAEADRAHAHFGRDAHCLEHGPKVNARGENKKQETARTRREHHQQQAELFAPAKGIRA